MLRSRGRKDNALALRLGGVEGEEYGPDMIVYYYDIDAILSLVFVQYDDCIVLCVDENTLHKIMK